MNEQLLSHLYPEYNNEPLSFMSIIDLDNPQIDRELLDMELIDLDYEEQ